MTLEEALNTRIDWMSKVRQVFREAEEQSKTRTQILDALRVDIYTPLQDHPKYVRSYVNGAVEALFPIIWKSMENQVKAKDGNTYKLFDEAIDIGGGIENYRSVWKHSQKPYTDWS